MYIQLCFQFREIYAEAVGQTNIWDTERYKEAIKSIHFFSREDLLLNIEAMLSELNSHDHNLDDIINNLQYHMDTIQEASLENICREEETQENTSNKIKSRLEWQKV